MAARQALSPHFSKYLCYVLFSANQRLEGLAAVEGRGGAPLIWHMEESWLILTYEGWRGETLRFILLSAWRREAARERSPVCVCVCGAVAVFQVGAHTLSPLASNWQPGVCGDTGLCIHFLHYLVCMSALSSPWQRSQELARAAQEGLNKHFLFRLTAEADDKLPSPSISHTGDGSPPPIPPRHRLPHVAVASSREPSVSFFWRGGKI